MRSGKLAATTLLVALALAVAPVEARPATCTVQRGDSLSSIAKRYGVSVTDLRRWNHLRKDRIRPGDRLHLRPATRLYKVKKGDTLAKIAKREGGTVEDIVDLNPGIDGGKLRAGEMIEVPGGEVNGPAHPSKEQKRAARRGKREKCPNKITRVPKHVGYRRAHTNAGWATAQTNEFLRRGFSHVLSRHKLAPRVEVLDASLKDLGPVGDHRSHQQGRDVDISYYQKICPRRGCPSEVVSPRMLDVRRQWTLLRYWLKRDQVEMIFIDRGLQAKLYEYAKKRGAKKKQLDEWFQYPRPAGSQEGIIRHWPGHRNHLHVRFKTANGSAATCK